VSRRDAGYDFLAEKNWRGPIKRAADRLELGECLARYVFDRADSLNCMRRFKGKNEWERQRSVTEKPAPIAGTAAFDLAKSGHRRSPLAWCFMEQLLSLSQMSRKRSGVNPLGETRNQ